MATIVTRAGKGSALTHTEMDANFTNLNNDKLESGAVTTSGLTMATGKLLGRSTASTGAVEEITLGSGLTLSSGTLTASGGGAGTDLGYTASTRLLTSSTGTDVTLPLFTGTAPGLVNLSGGGTTNFLRADGSWAAPPSGGAGTDLGYTPSTQLLTSSTGTDVTLPLFSTTNTNAGLVPGNSNLGATYFLNADGSWAIPAGGGSGTVTSVAVSSSGSITVGGSPITSSGTITVNLNTANANSFTGQQTFKEIKETTFTLATSGTIALDPANGSIQSSVLTGNPTFTDSLEAGQTLVLHLDNGSSYTVQYPTPMTWVGTTSSSTPPTLTANDVLVFWKFGTTLYGAYVGSYV